ncbi:MAG: YgjP-like metallopeptidase domain-containing protein, partial [Pseudomonadota bacterium]
MRLEDPRVVVEVRRTRAARRLSLTVSHVDRTVRVSAPPRCTDAALLKFLEQHKAWLRGALAAAPDLSPIADGAWLPFAGAPLFIKAHPGRRGSRLLQTRLDRRDAREHGLSDPAAPSATLTDDAAEQ